MEGKGSVAGTHPTGALDENAHPRARKPVLEKFYLSIKRVMESSLSEEMKNAIVMAYITELERL